VHPARQLTRDVVADNLRAARARARLKQDDVAERMRSLGFDTWSRATVSEIERRNRGVAVDELVTLAVVFGTPIATLLDHQQPEVTPADIDDAPDRGTGLAMHAVDRVLRGGTVFTDWQGNDQLVGTRAT